MRVGVTWEIAGVLCDPAPGHALHVRHLRAFVDARCMMHFLFQDRENSGRGWVPRPPSADAGPRDADTVAIYIRHLLGGAGHDQQRSLGRTLWLPDIFAGLQRYCFWRDPHALGKGFGRSREWLKNEQGSSEDKDEA